jgi:hypothetical protein
MRSIFEKANSLPKIVFPALLLSIFIGLSSQAVAAPLPCGDIVAPEYFFNPGPFAGISLEQVAVEDCGDPFSVTTNPASPYTLNIDGVEIREGDTYILNDSIQNIFTIGRGQYDYVETFLFKHEEGDYIFVDESLPELLESEYLSLAETYFDKESELEQYMEILIDWKDGAELRPYFYDDESDFILDSQTGETIRSRFYNFIDFAEQHQMELFNPYLPGTYTIVIKESSLFLTQNSILDKVRDFFIKTAHAQNIVEPNFYTITFTIADATPEPVGASSVLFLPGIMGSRLYEVSVECNPLDDNSSEQARWFSYSSCDTQKLSMTSLGLSEYNIYTKPDGVIKDIAAILNLYDSLLDDLEEWREDDIIADYRAVPYDWRLSLHDILKTKLEDGRIVYNAGLDYKDGYIYQSLEYLVESSPKRKVVLVGHSNGGLVIKALLTTMKEANDPLLESIEKVILVAVPQVGTPESVVGFLHGVAIGGGLVL